MIKSNSRHIFHKALYALAGLSMMVLTCCSSDNGPSNSASAEEDIYVSFILSAGFQSSPTRAEYTEIFGTTAENHIDLHNLRILVFKDDPAVANDFDNTLYDIVYDCGRLKEGASLDVTSSGDYRLTLKLHKNRSSNVGNIQYDPESKYAIVALTNWSSRTENSKFKTYWPASVSFDAEGMLTATNIGKLKLNELKGVQFDLNPSSVAGNQGGVYETWIPGSAGSDSEAGDWIPMFGSLYATFADYNSHVFNEANPMHLGTINLVRAFAKIEVIDATDNRVEITKIELEKRNEKGSMLQDFTFTSNTDQVSLPTLPSQPNYSEDRPVLLKKVNNIYTVYVPELSFNADAVEDRKALKVYMTFKDLDGHSTEVNVKYIYLTKYENGKPVYAGDGYATDWQNIRRNHIYRFTISSVTPDKMDVKVNVQPYTEKRLYPEFGLERTDDGYIIVRDADGNIVKYIRYDGSDLHFEEKSINGMTFNGVLDDIERVLVGYFNDGRMIYFNYDSSNTNPSGDDYSSWEIYAPMGHGSNRMYLQSDYIRAQQIDSGGNVILPAFTRTVYDLYGWVTERYSYGSDYIYGSSTPHNTYASCSTENAVRTITYFSMDGRSVTTITAKIEQYNGKRSMIYREGSTIVDVIEIDENDLPIETID